VEVIFGDSADRCDLFACQDCQFQWALLNLNVPPPDTSLKPNPHDLARSPEEFGHPRRLLSDSTYKDIAYVRAEVEHLAEQLAAVSA